MVTQALQKTAFKGFSCLQIGHSMQAPMVRLLLVGQYPYRATLRSSMASWAM